MPFPFECPHCGATYRIKDELAGKQAKCKKCEKVMTLKAPPVEPERSEGGSVMYRHQARERELELATGDSELIEAVEAHIRNELGEYDNVFHELVSDLVHVDIHLIPPRKARPWQTLVTSGMSERPMHTPEEIEGFDYAELFVCLPPNWPLDEKSLEDTNYSWPMEALKYLVCLPHEYETWLGPGHTVPNGDPPEPFGDKTPFSCFMIAEPMGVPESFAQLEVPDGRVVNFLAMVPLFTEEMNFKLKKGSDALAEKLASLSPPEYFIPKRQNTCKKRFGLF